ncbi:ribonuclease HI family protein [Macrococcoides caseolyticum]|uniref:ribonuclease HI family protein n=1 Tax=Macrococcoides caseolyticum TaxID=69966 RepID=UPI001F2007EB|nr:ribonuclease HI family protein [Macrococcus caseolyticus]MCE4957031.1 ribonuclease HI family protein [Macrococcus caseolyticus]
MAQIFIDASTKQSPLHSACGIVLKMDDKQIEYGEYLGAVDNHIAEWQSLIIGVKLAIEHQCQTLLIKSDSKIVVDSIDKNFVKHSQYKRYLDEYNKLITYFDLVIINWVPRQQNKHADTIARRTLQHYL